MICVDDIDVESQQLYENLEKELLDYRERNR